MKQTYSQVVWPLLMLLLSTGGGCSREEPAAGPAQVPSVEIPLNKIWAWEMPGTLDIMTLEPDHFGPAVRQLLEQEQVDLLLSSLSQQIDFEIGRLSDEKQLVGPGFAVEDTGHKALAAIKEILEQDQMPQQNFPAGTDVSLFFFTRNSGWPVQLKSVSMSKNTIAIQYYFVPHKSNGTHAKVLNRYFALIPLGKLPEGSYEVVMVQTTEKKYTGRNFQTVGKGTGAKRVCKSFAFTIVQDEEEANINE